MRLFYKIVAFVCATGWMVYFMCYHYKMSHRQIVPVSQWLTETTDRKSAAMSPPSPKKTTWSSHTDTQAGSSAKKKDSQETLQSKESFEKMNGFPPKVYPQTVTLESKESFLKHNGLVQKNSPRKTIQSQAGFVSNEGFVQTLHATKQQQEWNARGLQDARTMSGSLLQTSNALNNPGVVHGSPQQSQAKITSVNSVSPVNTIPPLNTPMQLLDPNLHNALLQFLQALQNQDSPLLPSNVLQPLQNQKSTVLPSNVLQSLQNQASTVLPSNVLQLLQNQESTVLPSNVLQSLQNQESPLLPSNVLQSFQNQDSPLLPSNTLQSLQDQESPLLPINVLLQSLKNQELPFLPSNVLQPSQTPHSPLVSNNQNGLQILQNQESSSLSSNVLQTGQNQNLPLLSSNVLHTLQTHETLPLSSIQSALQPLQNQEKLLFHNNVLQTLQNQGSPLMSNNPNEVNSLKQTATPNSTMSSFTEAWREIQAKFLPQYFRSVGFNATEGLGGRREPVPLTEVEERYLATPPLTEFYNIPDELQSKVTPLSTPDSHRVGSNVVLRVDLYDQRGRRRTMGGDEVRVWLTYPAGQGQGHSTAGRVTDLGNGSYAGEVTLHWEGPAFVKVSVTYPREFLRLVVELRHGLLSTRYVTGRFSTRAGQQSVSEITPCLPSQPIPGYASTCNLTEFNDWLPWFCGQPINAGLRCEDFSRTGNTPFPFVTPLPVSEPVNHMVQYLQRPGHIFRLVPNDILVLTQPGPPTLPLPPCWSRPPRESWELLSHGGTLRAGEWIPDHCALPAYSERLVQRCLQNTTILMFGDSNMLKMYEFLYKPLGLPQIVEKRMRPKYMEVPWLNSSLFFSHHALPLNPEEANPGQEDLQTMSLAHALQTLPARHHHIIVLHYWLHMGFYPVHVFRERVRWARRVMQDYLAVQPSAKFFIRGPHVVYDSNGHHAHFGDKYGPWFIHILKQELRELYDMIWLLDFWPLTVASENVDLHPPGESVQQMVRVLLGYACRDPVGG